MRLTHTPALIEAWLEWFEAVKSTQCRASLCTTYGLNALNTEALMNTARLQVDPNEGWSDRYADA